LPFTTDEVWETSDSNQSDSVHLEEFRPSEPERIDAALEADWTTILRVRQAVTRELEGLREGKVIGSSLGAQVEVSAEDPAEQVILERHASALEEAFIVSAVQVRPAEAMSGVEPTEEGFRVVVEPSSGEKCDRCWRFREDVGHSPEHPGLCAECTAILSS
jgi:isoleucyl-tRNA synthetase